MDAPLQSIVELSDEETLVTIALHDGIVSLNDDGTKVLTVVAKALDEGVWNGVYFKPDDIQEKLEKLSGRRVLVSHTYEKPDDVMGWVESVDSETGNATLKIFDSNAIQGIEDGTLNAVSVGVLVQQKNGVANILDFNEISLTGNPACATCVINSFSEQTLEKEDDNMTDEEIITEEELCDCEEEPATIEEEVIEETVENTQEEVVVSETLEQENVELKSTISTMQEQISILRAHKDELELERKTAERQNIVDDLVESGAYKPANSENLHSLLMTFSDEQLALFEKAAEGLGAVVLEEDIGEVEYIPPHATQATELENDIAEFRALMGRKN